jgi:hypothetical protein
MKLYVSPMEMRTPSPIHRSPYVGYQGSPSRVRTSSSISNGSSLDELPTQSVVKIVNPSTRQELSMEDLRKAAGCS